MSHFRNLINPSKPSLPTCHCNYCFDKKFSFFKTQIISNLESHLLVVYDLFFLFFHLSFCVFFVELQENRTLKPPPDTTTAITAQANTQAIAGALMAHHLPRWAITRVGPGLSPQYTRAHFGGEAVGCSATAHKCHDSMSPNDYKRRTLPQHGSGASFRTTEHHKVTQVSKEQDVSTSQPADRVFCTACPTEGKADWSIVYKDEHEEEFLKSDDEIAMKVMINEDSTLLSVVTTGKAPTEGIGSQGTGPVALLSGFVMDRQRKEGGQAWSDPRLHPERVFREQEAPHLRRCTRVRGFIQNMTTGALQAETSHNLVADRQPNHLDACAQNSSPTSCRVHTKRGIC